MREAAERLLQTHPGFSSIAGKAENTTLDNESVDFAVVGRPFIGLRFRRPVASSCAFSNSPDG